MLSSVRSVLNKHCYCIISIQSSLRVRGVLLLLNELLLIDGLPLTAALLPITISVPVADVSPLRLVAIQVSRSVMVDVLSGVVRCV